VEWMNNVLSEGAAWIALLTILSNVKMITDSRNNIKTVLLYVPQINLLEGENVLLKYLLY
jgi:hypothetical protein